jgi:N-acylneuraminate cytidylyltransferase
MNVAYIPLRGGSKSIPLKNIKPLAGKPLAYWVIKAACECTSIDMVYVSTDSDTISGVISDFAFQKLRIVGRSAESATDTASTEFAMLEFAKKHTFSNIALIQATSPLLSSQDLANGFNAKQKDNVDSVLSVVKQKRFIWQDNFASYAKPLNYDYTNRPLRQNFDGLLVENGAFYITSRDALLQSNCRLSGNIKTVEMPEWTYIELDEPDDWIVVESFLQKKHKVDRATDIKMFLTDCDGTLTDGGMYYSPNGEEMKKFNTRDGAGLRMLKERGVIVGIITGESSDIVLKRAEKLNVDEFHLGISDKLETIKTLCNKYKIDKQNVAYIGDDLNDYDAICNVGLGMCVADSANEIKEISTFVTIASGGKGAVREAAEFCLHQMI